MKRTITTVRVWSVAAAPRNVAADPRVGRRRRWIPGFHVGHGGPTLLPVAPRLFARLVSSLLFCVTALAADPRDLIAQGNAHYAAGRYAEALQSYEQAASTGAAPSTELLHDQAATHFKLGQIDEARELWVRAKTLGDAAFEARSRYNLGNCDYADALATAQGQDAQKALKLLAQAADEYRNALHLDPTLADARANLELTHLLKKQIEEQQQNQPQSQPSSQPCSQPSSQPSSQSSQSQPSSQQSQSQQQKQDQSSQSSQPQTQPAQPPESQPQPQDQQKEPESQPESQPAPAETQPAESQPAEQQEQGEQPPSANIRLTPAQAERMLQMVRDAEKARREMLAQMARDRMAREKRVDRDW